MNRAGFSGAPRSLVRIGILMAASPPCQFEDGPNALLCRRNVLGLRYGHTGRVENLFNLAGSAGTEIHTWGELIEQPVPRCPRKSESSRSPRRGLRFAPAEYPPVSPMIYIPPTALITGLNSDFTLRTPA